MTSLVEQSEYPQCPGNDSLLSMLMVILTMGVCISDVLSFAILCCSKQFCVSTI